MLAACPYRVIGRQREEADTDKFRDLPSGRIGHFLLHLRSRSVSEAEKSAHSRLHDAPQPAEGPLAQPWARPEKVGKLPFIGLRIPEVQ